MTMTRQTLMNHPKHPWQFIKATKSLKIFRNVGRIFDRFQKSVIFIFGKAVGGIGVGSGEGGEPGVTFFGGVDWGGDYGV